MKEIPAFQVKHARCMTHPVQKMRAGPKPELLDAAQTAALSKLNQHFDKPRDEVIRCQKLWSALFPAEPFDPRVMGEYLPRYEPPRQIRRDTHNVTDRKVGTEEPESPGCGIAYYSFEDGARTEPVRDITL